MGTLDYMAPEQWEDSQAVDTRADLYSLGCTLYHLLTGAPPFAAYEGRLAKMLAHAREPVPPVRGKRPGVPESLVPVLERLLAKKPDERYATPAEVAVALDPFTVGCDLPNLHLRHGATPTRPREPAAALVMGGAAAPSLQRPNKRTVKITKVFVGVLAFVALVSFLAFFGKAMFGSQDSVRIDPLEITLYRGEKSPVAVETIGTRPALAARVGEAVRVHVQLSRPAYCYLIAYNPDGKEQVCYPQDATTPPEPVKEFVYPAGANVFRFREEDCGFQAFILAASRKPLPPYARWKAEAGDSPWEPVQGEGVWSYDGQNFEPLGSHRGQVEAFPDQPKPFENVCKFLKDGPHIEAIRGLAFPVRQGPAKANP
jgi:hypothetical protein